MKLLLELSGEHDTLAKAEVCAVLEAERIPATFEQNQERVLIATFDDVKYGREATKKALVALLRNRLALTHSINELLHECAPTEEALIAAVHEIDLGEVNNTTYAVRVRRLHRKSDQHSVSLEQRIGKAVAGVVDEGSTVDLTDPAVTLRIILAERGYICIVRAEIDRGVFEKRTAKSKPYFHPTGLHPKTARLMVNLSQARPSDVLLDPFCGTGSILLEAELMGIQSIGGDVDGDMVEGCSRNLKYYGIQPDVHHGDISTIFERIKEVGAIVTDPPYARSSTTLKEPLNVLYDRMFYIFKRVLKAGHYLVLALPDEAYIALGSKHFTLCARYEIRVHKSLTRTVCIFKNEKSE